MSPRAKQVDDLLPSRYEVGRRGDGILRHRRRCRYNPSYSDSTDDEPLLVSLSDSVSSGSNDSFESFSKGGVFYFPYPVLMCLMFTLFIVPTWYILLNGLSESVAPPSSSPPPPPPIDALVYVALGPMAESQAFGWSIKSAIENGQWNRDILIITDRDEESRATIMNELGGKQSRDWSREGEHKIMFLQPSKNAEEISKDNGSHGHAARTTKTTLFKTLDDINQDVKYLEGSRNTKFSARKEKLHHILYVDADVFIRDSLLKFEDSILSTYAKKENNDKTMAMFRDDKAFTWGTCWKCEKFNTGVMSLRRDNSLDPSDNTGKCMQAWSQKFLGGSDQEALDKVQATDCHIAELDLTHVRMMKDFFVVLGFVGTRTFNHFTTIYRPCRLSNMHTNSYKSVLRSYGYADDDLEELFQCKP